MRYNLNSVIKCPSNQKESMEMVTDLKRVCNPNDSQLLFPRISKKLDHEDTDSRANDQPKSTNSHLSKFSLIHIAFGYFAS